MILYRAMCEVEASETLRYKSLAWNSRFKWFGPKDFVTFRVQDRQFNNSQFIQGRYSRLIQFTFKDSDLIHFQKCGKSEFMLDRRKAHHIKILDCCEVNHD